MFKKREFNVTLCFFFQREVGRKKPVYVATTSISNNREGNTYTKLAAEKLRGQDKVDINSAKVKHICKQLRDLSKKKENLSTIDIYINDSELAYALDPDAPLFYRQDAFPDLNLINLWDKTIAAFNFVNTTYLEENNDNNDLELYSDVVANSLRAIAISCNADSPVKRETKGRLPRPNIHIS